MALSERFTGSDIVVEWLPDGGVDPTNTKTLSSDFTSFSMDKKVDTVDVTAGSEDNRSFLATLKSLDWTLSLFATTDANIDTVEEATKGKLTVYPKGKTIGQPMRSFNTIINSVSVEYPFDGAVEIEIGGMRTGAMITDIGDTYAG